MNTEYKPINGKAIYTPKGAALEYGRIGANFYTGCPHDCEYCYLKRGITGKVLGGTEVKLKKCFKDEADAIDVFCNEGRKHLELCRRYGIFFSFTTDPLIPETRNLTISALGFCVDMDIRAMVLTKNADFINDARFQLNMKAGGTREFIHFGFTLTGRDDMEPKASSNDERIEAMRHLHEQGFKTFASIEPVIDFVHSEVVIGKSIDCCDHYKIGLRSGVKRGYYNPSQVYEHIRTIVDFITDAGKTVYLKQSVRTLIGTDYNVTMKQFEDLVARTVDMDGKPFLVR